jgi:hypothetical protein
MLIHAAEVVEMALLRNSAVHSQPAVGSDNVHLQPAVGSNNASPVVESCRLE